MNNPNQAGSPPAQQNRARQVNIQPSQVNQLVQALKNELALAKAAGNDRAQAQQHYAKAESIKQVLLNYQAQQKARQQQLGGTPQPNLPQLAGTPQPSAPARPASQAAIPNATNTQQFPQQHKQPRQASPPAQQTVTPVPTSSSSSSANNVVTLEKFNQVKARLVDFERKIQSLEASKRQDLTVEQAASVDSQLTEFRTKFSQYQKFALYMKNQLVEQARSAGGSAGSTYNSGTPSAAPALAPAPASVLLPAVKAPGSDAGAASTPAAQASDVVAEAQNAKAGKSASPQAENATSSSSLGPPAINLSGITKPSVPSLPISSSINVKPPVPVILKPGSKTNNRATLTGGVANGMGQIIGSPAIQKMPTYDLANNGSSLPDNAGRVLTKRKLTELVNTIGADEGDGKTNIDGDVEELLLDLADEFITSVTGFACRLSKHRKVDTVDVRDVQLHLEKNWNIRIPGYAMDEIRATRKWQPSSTYNQKVSGVEISKSVNGNLN